MYFLGVHRYEIKDISSVRPAKLTAGILFERAISVPEFFEKYVKK